MEAIEQLLDVGVTIKVEVLERVAVAREERPDAKRRPRVSGADEQRVADALRDQLGPSIDERRHQHLAHFGVSLNERVHLVACQLDDFTRLAHAKAHQRRAIEDHADVAGESARLNNGNKEVAEARWPDDLYLANLHNKEGHVPLTALDQHFPARDWTNHTMGDNPRDLCCSQRRKQE